MVLLTPVMHVLHRRFGLLVPLVLVGLVAAGDAARLGLGMSTLAVGNYLFAWLAVHQVGFAWQDGRLPARPGIAALLLLGGLTALLLLTVAGPYPVSMVNVPGEDVQNTAPPTLALLALATTQLGSVLLLRGPSARWLQRPRPWLAVVTVNTVVLTVFLWHMSAVVLATVALHLTGLLPTPPVNSPEWLLWRVPWLVMLAVALGLLVAVFGPIEARGRRRPMHDRLPTTATAMAGRGRLRDALTVAGFAAVVLGLVGIAVAGEAVHRPFGLPTGAVAAYLVGAAVLRLVSSASHDRRSADRPVCGSSG